MASQLLGIKTRFTNDLGSPLVGGQVYTYFAGTSTNQDSYSDAALTVPNTNPVILDDTGSADIFLKGSYRIRVFDKSGRFIEEQDNVTQAASQGDANGLRQQVDDLSNDVALQKLDTGITVTAKFGGVERTQADKNMDTLNLSDFVTNIGDKLSDHTTQLNLAGEVARAQGKRLVGAGKFYIKSGDVNFRHTSLDLINCEFICEKPYKLILGGSSATSVNPVQLVGVVRHDKYKYTDEEITDPCVRVIGAKGQIIGIRVAQYLQFYMSTDPLTYPQDSSIAYNTFNLGYIMKLEIDTDPRFASGTSSDGAGSANQWFNENVINLEHCHVFKMIGSYKHNHNIINGGVFENNSKLIIDIGNKNYFRNQRFEGSAHEIYLGKNTMGNVVERTWFGSAANFWKTPNVIDLGELNDVRHYSDKNRVKREVFSLSPLDTVFDKTLEVETGLGLLNRVGNPHRIAAKSSYSYIYKSDFTTLRKNETLFVNVRPNDYSIAQGMPVNYLTEIILYDSNFQQIMNTDTIEFRGNYTSNPTNNPNTLRGSVHRTSYFYHLSDVVRYVRVNLISSASNQDYADSVTCFISSNTPQDASHVLKAKQLASTNLTRNVPTAFYGQYGAAVQCAPHGVLYNVKYLTSTVQSPISATQFNISNRGAVEPTSYMAKDYYVTIVNSAQLSHSSVVTSVVGNTVTIDLAAPFALKSGDVVYINQLVGVGKTV